jgi:3-hydroxyacyl-CoA dehydrogenase
MIKRIGVIGAGQMGSGIAHVCALKGFDIRLMDIDQPHINSGIENIGRNMDRQIGRGMIRPEDKDSALKRITTATDFKPFADCDLIVEAATENESVKRDIFKKLCEGLPPNVLLATNTSSISVTRLASVTDRPGKFMGMHFMNPVPLMGLVELIRGIATEEETFRTVRDVVVKLDKKPVNAEDFLHALRRRRQRRGDRHRHETRRQPSDGPARAGRLHRPRYLPLGDAGAARGSGGFQVPAVPAAGEVRRGGLGRPQGQARLL